MTRVVSADVAADAGVSKSTVSNFFNAPEKLSADVAQRIQASIDKLGYVRNDAARQLRAGRSNVIAYVVFEVGNTYFSDVANAMDRRAAEAGLFVTLGNNNGDLQRERAYLELFEAQGVRGLVVAPVGPIDPVLELMRKRGTPSVITGRPSQSPDQPSISVENTRGGYLAAKHLLDSGRSHLAFVGGPLSIQQISDRLAGASLAVQEKPGATLEIHAVSERTVEAGRKAAAAFLAAPAGRRPDGVFAANDMVALGIINAISEGSTLRVPDDIAVIGFDDLDIATAGSVPLSTIRTPHDDYGRITIELLLAELGELPPLPEKQVVLQPELVARASTLG